MTCPHICNRARRPAVTCWALSGVVLRSFKYVFQGAGFLQSLTLPYPDKVIADLRKVDSPQETRTSSGPVLLEPGI